MSLAYDVAPRDAARTLARDDLVERRLRRFREPLQPRVRALARRHARLGDLAVSFPALLLALAFPRRDLDAEAVIARVIAGAPLKALAEMAHVPIWLRQVKAEAFTQPLPLLPAGAWFAHRIANHFPRSVKRVSGWLQSIADAYAWADEAIALWVARELALKDLPKRRRRPMATDLRFVTFWAWNSEHGAMPELFDVHWSPEMGMQAAIEAALDWRESLLAHLELGEGPVEDMWLPEGTVGRYELVPLRTAADIITEARAMKHCIRTHSGSVAHGHIRLWSVRENGERVATMMVGRRFPSPLLEVQDLRGFTNLDVPAEMWATMLGWMRENELPPEAVRPREWRPLPISRSLWTKLWRPYWLAKRRIPEWLPLAPDPTLLWLL